jgi:hypothetical protein
MMVSMPVKVYSIFMCIYSAEVSAPGHQVLSHLPSTNNTNDLIVMMIVNRDIKGKSSTFDGDFLSQIFGGHSE